MQTWKNITVHLHDWDLKKAAEQLNNLNVLSITIIDKLPQEYSQWYEENKETTPIHSSSHSLILLADMSKDTEDLLSEVKFMLKLDVYHQPVRILRTALRIKIFAFMIPMPCCQDRLL